MTDNPANDPFDLSGVPQIGFHPGTTAPFDVDIERIRALGTRLRDSATALEPSSAEIPGVDAGLMTQVIEGEIKLLLERVRALAEATVSVAEAVSDSASNYQKSDAQAEQAMLHVAANLPLFQASPTAKKGAADERSD